MGALALYSKETGVMAVLIGAGFSAIHFFRCGPRNNRTPARFCSGNGNGNRNWKVEKKWKKGARQSPGKMDEENFLDRGKLLLLTTDITVVGAAHIPIIHTALE